MVLEMELRVLHPDMQATIRKRDNETDTDFSDLKAHPQ